jgi:squalene-associated FAD-dependent desaturase
VSGTRLVVVGGGIAGTTAALHAADEGHEVVLLERRPRLGGLAASFERDGLQLDMGQHVFLRCCTAYRQLLERMGATDLVTLQDRLDVPVLLAHPGRPTRRTRLRRSTRPLPPPLHLAGALAGYAGIPAAQRLPAALTAMALGRVDPGSSAADQQSFGEWLRARGATRASVEALWELLTVATLNTPVAEASLALAAKVVRTGLLETADGGDIGHARVPLGRIHHEAALRALGQAGVRVEVSTAVRALRHDPASGWWVATDDAEICADAVVLATPPGCTADLLPEASAGTAAKLRRIQHSPIVNVVLVYDRPVLDVPFLAVVGSPLQWIFDRTASAGVERGQCLAVSLSAADEWIDRPTSEVRDMVTRELARVSLAARATRVRLALVAREREATPRQSAGTGSLRPTADTRIPGLALAGAWTATGWPATMEGAARSGIAASQCALRTASHGVRRDTRAGAA